MLWKGENYKHTLFGGRVNSTGKFGMGFCRFGSDYYVRTIASTPQSYSFADSTRCARDKNGLSCQVSFLEDYLLLLIRLKSLRYKNKVKSLSFTLSFLLLEYENWFEIRFEIWFNGVFYLRQVLIYFLVQRLSF